MNFIHFVQPNTETLCLLTLISDTLIKSFEVQWTEFSNLSDVSMVTAKQPVLKPVYNLLNANLAEVCAILYIRLQNELQNVKN